MSGSDSDDDIRELARVCVARRRYQREYQRAYRARNDRNTLLARQVPGLKERVAELELKVAQLEIKLEDAEIELMCLRPQLPPPIVVEEIE